ncbi:MAG: gamma-glutamyl-gamma-aminobutyrate hydrolase family protein [Aquisalimonadaceae bacterium]
MKPRIGITGPDRGGLAAWLFTSWAVRRAGGHPLRITPRRPRPVDDLDGLIVGGGADVDPALYGETRAAPALRELHRRSRSLAAFLLTLVLFPLIWILRRLLSSKQLQGRNHERDTLESALLKEALARGLPVLGICRGAQLLNVVCGGSLHQRLDDFYDEAPNLYTIWPQKTVEVSPDSRLAAILGQPHCQVNSLHRQAIREPGQGLQAVARERNSVIQAIEHTDHACVLGVQWHPEYLPQRTEQRALFEALVAHSARQPAVP